MIIMAEGRLSLGTEVRRLRLGESFSKGSTKNFHTFRYDFKPASMDTKKVATVEIGATNQATVTVPHVEGSGTAHTVFKGSRKPYTKECVLIIDNVTGEIVLEKLNSNVQLKKTRTEATRKQPNAHSQRPSTPVEGGGTGNSATSHSSKRTASPPHSKHSSPVHHYHGSQTSLSPPIGLLAVNQRSPVNQLSPSMPSLLTPNLTSNNNNNIVKTSVPSMPMLFGGGDEEEHQQQQITGGDASDATSEVGFLSDSSNDSSSGSSSSSSSSDSSDNENEEKETSNKALAPMKLSVPTNSQQSSNSFPSMPQFSQLTEDLQLSESGSDSDS